MSRESRRVNLILVPDLKHHEVDDFHRIVAIIKTKCSDVVPSVISSRFSWNKKWWLALRPSLYVGLRPIRNKKPLRGLMLHGQGLSKDRQYELLKESGLTTLRWTTLSRNTVLNPEEWGDFVVMKPEGGKRGRDVRIVKIRKARYKEEMEHEGKWVVQQFVHTGPQPVSYRVLTLFGKALYCMRSENTACGERLEKAESLRDFAGHNIVATARDGEITLVQDTDVIEFAAKVAEVFSVIPVLGIDVIRDVNTGELYCVEVNPYGQTWHFSSILGRAIQESNGFIFEQQFGAFDIAADVLIATARRLAK